ncbi:hypothetical protein [Alicyclobacillus kakegawensis]|uniref:hypothetical protein n=1 Tax=Alicyclobacillus kakegawensis TaxID=392012 RepID=UPI000833A03A|nr:hypothetical protein [Alicyclobacillus kakegawensis]
MLGDACWAYWRDLVRLLGRPRSVLDHLSQPLATAILRCRWATAWSVIVAALASWTIHPDWPTQAARLVSGRPVHPALANFGFVLAVLVSIPIVYSGLRLYTLIHHVVAVNVCRTAGIRLKLLNLETKLLPLTVLFAIGWVGTAWQPWLGRVWLAAVSVLALWLLGEGHNAIFVRRRRKRLGRLGGIGLWLTAKLLTLFILAVGAAAIAVAISVISFLVLLLLRPGHTR